MRLSDAIGLGRTLIKLDAWQWLSRDRTCGCAIGMGLVAVGETSSDAPSEEKIKRVWPWLVEQIPGECLSYRARISSMALHVEAGQLTLDQLIDYVRSVEPAEPEVSESVQQEPEYATIT